MNIQNPIHSGENTHHHDQSIYPVSFNPMNRIVSKPQKPIPPLEEELELFPDIISPFMLRKASNDPG
jgi:hypothetical protein